MAHSHPAVDPPRPPALTDHRRNPASRLWRKDVSLWPARYAESISARLGWLDCVEWMRPRAGELRAWAAEVVAGGRWERVLVLGMGGSSLAPAVFGSLFEPAPGHPSLQVVDTTHPDQIARIAGGDLRRCLFIVASKSGATVETAALYQLFRARLAAQCDDPHDRFVIITDAGSDLRQQAQADRCRRIFIHPDDVGGRYAALSYVGLAPAALLGVDVGQFLERARAFCAATHSDHPAHNPALDLGMFLGRGALAGRDKLMLWLPRRLGVFGLWVEQLVAESTGKDGKGLVPVVVGGAPADDSVGESMYRGEDRLHVRYDAAGADGATERALALDDPYQLGAEYFRWEMATAIAAGYLGVNPFDQPDVARSKDRARLFIHGRARPPAPTCRGGRYDLYWRAGDGGADAGAMADDMADGATDDMAENIADVIAEFHRTLGPGCYLGLLACLPEDERTLALLQSLGARAARRWGIVSTLGFGPRYLHSTGQLHKGGPPTGRFLQFIAECETDVPVPRREYTFGRLHRAQADGDFSALAEGGGVVMRVRLKADRLRALAAFVDDFTGLGAPAGGLSQAFSQEFS